MFDELTLPGRLRHTGSAAAAAPLFSPCGREHDPAEGVAEHVVVVPVYNEESAVEAVLEGIEAAGYRSMVIVDDGSVDDSPAILDRWSASRPWCRVIHMPQNQGKSAALRVAWNWLREELRAGTFCADTMVICVDADGQHDLGYLEALIGRMRSLRADAVIARRDLSYHGLYKRAGNWVMAAIGSVLAGAPIHDIESGYRIVRLGPLLHAQEFYEGRLYSEGAELAVVLPRLGYRVDNEFVVRVPIPRTRTHLTDAANHAVTMLGAWYRVTSWREVPGAQRSVFAAVLSAAVIVAFALFIGAMLLQPVYLGNDSGQSYAHVWALSRAIFSGEGIPLRLPQLESGQAYMFPYGALPWLPAALLHPVLGDWAVTASMGAGVAVLLVGVWRWLPRTASPLLTGVMLLNWQLWNGVLQFQLPTIWAFAFACLAAGSFDRGRSRSATALAACALIAHPIMGAAGLAMTTAARIEADRALPVRRLGLLAVATVIASPAIWLFLQTPSMAVLVHWSWATSLHITAQRLSMLWWPWLLQRIWPVLRRWQAPLLLLGVAILVRNVMGSNPQNLLWQSQPRFPDYLAAGLVQPEVQYRVLVMNNEEDGMTQLLQAGATLAQEYFDESIYRHSFGSTEAYRCFLQAKHAQRVLVQARWITRGTSNEVDVLDRLVGEGHAILSFRGAAGTREYTITSPPPASCAPAR